MKLSSFLRGFFIFLTGIGTGFFLFHQPDQFISGSPTLKASASRPIPPVASALPAPRPSVPAPTPAMPLSPPAPETSNVEAQARAEESLLAETEPVETETAGAPPTAYPRSSRPGTAPKKRAETPPAFLPGAARPLDKKLARTFLGRYEGTLNYSDPQTSRRYVFNLTLDLNNLNAKTNFLYLTPQGGTGGRKSFTNFRTQAMSTDPEAGTLNIAWRNDVRNQSAYADYLSFEIPPPGISSFSATLYGMNSDGDWVAIGGTELKKTR